MALQANKSSDIVAAPADPAATMGSSSGGARETERPPVILLGGDGNSLSITRDLAKLGIKVYTIFEQDIVVQFSRFCTALPVPEGKTFEDAWARFLLGPQSDHLQGAVLLACGDIGIRVLAWNRDALLKRYRLVDSDPLVQLDMLDKLTTYQHSRKAGIPTPGFWEVTSRQQLIDLKPDMLFPLMFKPRIAHTFEEKFNRKHVIVDDFEELLRVYDMIREAGLEVILMEFIPGGDENLASYYTYLDENSEPLFHFTKRLLRRYPTGMGAATHHVTAWVPELPALANKLFKSAGLRGLANIEFKFDPRIGQYKIIEVNARFTASNCLATASGCRLSEFTYCRVMGLPLPDMSTYRKGVRMWDPVRDFWAFCELRRAGQITLLKWLASLPKRPVLPFFRLNDPMPALARLCKPLRRKLRSLRSGSAAERHASNSPSGDPVADPT